MAIVKILSLKTEQVGGDAKLATSLFDEASVYGFIMLCTFIIKLAAAVRSEAPGPGLNKLCRLLSYPRSD